MWNNAHYCTHNTEMRHCEATHGQRGRLEWSKGVQEARKRCHKADRPNENECRPFFLHRRSEKNHQDTPVCAECWHTAVYFQVENVIIWLLLVLLTSYTLSWKLFNMNIGGGGGGVCEERALRKVFVLFSCANRLISLLQLWSWFLNCVRLLLCNTSIG